ncbi:MAG TPA: TrbC/VirB2 family protein [Bacillota bacterium]|nr:TrbC/VirB2 family protein [Bacillota bacterium]
MSKQWRRVLGVAPLWFILAGAMLAPTAVAAPGGPGTAVITGFLANVAQWLEFIAGTVSVCTVAYGGVRHAAAHTSHAQAEAWRVIMAGLGGLVLALLAPTLVSVVQGLIPS